MQNTALKNIFIPRILSLVAISFIALPLRAQVFPVQANITITPPYTIHLSHYTSPTQQRILATAMLMDPVVTSVDVRFRFTVEGPGVRITTNPGWRPQPFSLPNGMLTQLPAELIAEYFQPQNIVVEGVNPQEFFRSGKLPEGFYRFKVEVLEYVRGVPISNVAQATAWLMLNEPPRMVFPSPNQKLKATNPQMLNFSWVPGGITSPLSALNTMYEFTLVELNSDIDPTVAITTASDAIKFTRTLQQTNLVYGPGDPPLTPGKRYAVRVRAYNTEGYEMFRNNGYSEVRVFQFGDACNPPLSFTLGNETQSTFTVDVQADPVNTAWVARLREDSDNSSAWTELKAEPTTATKTVKGLKPSTTYQVQVSALCGPFRSDYTPAQTISTKAKVNTQHDCENTVSPFVVQQASPLSSLKPNDMFLAALMPIRVTQVTRQGGGKFSGKGIATLPFISAGLAVTFDDIGINELGQLTSGEVKVVRDVTNATWFGDVTPPGTGGSGTTGTGTDSTGLWPPFNDTVTIDVPFDSVVVVNDSTIMVIPTGGGEAIMVNLGGSCALILPPDGNLDKAMVVYNGAAKPYRAGSGSDAAQQEQFSGFLARFKPSPASRYGFDTLRYQQLTAEYAEIQVNGKIVKVPWKALAVGIPDPVELHIRRNPDTLAFSKLSVGYLDGAALQPTAGANTATQTYTLTGTAHGDEGTVVATFKDTDGKTQYAGGLKTISFSPKSLKLYLVPLQGVDLPANVAGQVQEGLNLIYGQAVVSWTVEPLNGFPGVDLGSNGLDWADKELLSAYNAEMNSVIAAFKSWVEARKDKPDPDAYYLFVVPSFSESTVEGFMPLNRRFGFLAKEQLTPGNGASPLAVARTVAHELGHGVFNLRHTFSDKNFVTLSQGSTDNLMDYSTEKYALLKPQWDYIHDPQKMLFTFLQDEEEGAYKYWIADDYIQNKKVELAYWKWQKDGAPRLTIDEIGKKYFSSMPMNKYQKDLFQGIAADVANLYSRDKESAEMFKLLVEEGNIDAETLTALIKERHALAEYYRTVVPLLATGDILMKYCAILSVFSGPSSLPSMGKVGTYIAGLTGAKAANLASKISVTFAELQPSQWLMRTGKLFIQGAVIDATIQTGVNMVISDDFETAIGGIDFADVAITGAINVVTGGGVSLRKLFGAGTRIAVIKGTTIVTLELTAASIDWKPFNGSEQYVSIFGGDKDMQKFFCDFVLVISGNVLPDEMLDVFKKWSKSDFDVRWYSTLTAAEKAKVRKIYDIVHSSAFRGAIETNSAFVKTFLQNVINQNNVAIKTIKVEKFEYLPEEYIMPADNTKVVIPGTNGY